MTRPPVEAAVAAVAVLVVAVIVLAAACVRQVRETDRLRHQVACLRGGDGSGLYTRDYCGPVWWRSTP